MSLADRTEQDHHVFSPLVKPEPSHTILEPAASPPATSHKGDIGAYIGSISCLSDADKYALIVDPCVPPTKSNSGIFPLRRLPISSSAGDSLHQGKGVDR